MMTGRTIVREGLHAFLMFLATLPFYLYGGNVLYGNRLLEDAMEVWLFTIRAGITVVVVEILLDWIPYYGFKLATWREKYYSTFISGILFGMLSYFVITPRFFEGEAVSGMAALWIVFGTLFQIVPRRRNQFLENSVIRIRDYATELSTLRRM